MQTSVVEAMVCAALPHWVAQLPKAVYSYLLTMSRGKIAVLAHVRENVADSALSRQMAGGNRGRVLSAPAIAGAAGTGPDLVGDEININISIDNNLPIVVPDFGHRAGRSATSRRSAGIDTECTLNGKEMLQIQKTSDLALWSAEFQQTLAIDGEQLLDTQTEQKIDKQRMRADTLSTSLLDKLIVLQVILIIKIDSDLFDYIIARHLFVSGQVNATPDVHRLR